VSFDPNEEVGSQEEADTAWPDGTYARFRDNGFLYSTHPYTDLSYMHVIAAADGVLDSRICGVGNMEIFF
jgi:hypothetical protein